MIPGVFVCKVTEHAALIQHVWTLTFKETLLEVHLAFDSRFENFQKPSYFISSTDVYGSQLSSSHLSLCMHEFITQIQVFHEQLFRGSASERPFLT